MKILRASSIHRYRACLGSPKAEKDIPQPPDKAWTEDGNIVHDILKGKLAPKDASEELADIADRMDAIASWIVDKILPEGDGVERGELIRDRDEPFYVYQDGEPIISGHPDFIQLGTIYGRRVAIVLDFKSGFLEVPSPEINDQLRAYGVMVWQDEAINVDEIYASIVPRFGMAPTPVHYTHDDLCKALEDLTDIAMAVRQNDATRTPSVGACRYCRARSTSACNETLYPNERLTRMASLIELTPKEKGELLDLSEIARGNIKRLREILEEELRDDPAAVDGWQLVPGDKRSSLPDVPKTFDIVMESGLVTVEEWQSNCLKVAQKPLQDLMKDRIAEGQGIKKNAAMAQVKEILLPVTVMKQNKESLEKKP